MSVPLLLLVALLFVGASTAFAASDNATTSEGFTQGLQKGGGLVNILRSDPTDALGAANGEFVSLGYGGELIVGFDQNMSGNLLLTVQEVTGGVYPLETSDVYVSTAAAGPWTYVGEATNEGGLEDGASEFQVLECYQYVRVVDTTDSALHNDASDGFDIDSFTADYDETCPIVEEPDDDDPASPVKISLHSGAVVLNDTQTTANTGGNYADGSYAGSGGNGGDIENNGGEQDVEGATTGTGGNGGNGALGGAVQTGNALAESNITNTVNSNIVRVGDCGCDQAIGKVRIRTHSFAFVGNRMMTAANTGDNEALGSYAGEGGNGGDIENGGDGYDFGPFIVENQFNGDDDDEGEQEVDDSTTGNGGTGGNASDGGSVLTGAATSRATLVNTINSNTIRVR